MPIASRITSMTEHIQNAYDSIERFGVDTESIDKNLVNLSNTITNEIYDKLPKVSGNGSNFSLENAQNGKLDSFGMDGNTEQITYTGKNLLDIPDGSIVNQGVTVTRNNNVITFSGTATGTYPSTGSFPFTIAPGTYTISSTNNNYDFFLWFRNLNSDLINSANLHKGTKTITITSNNITALVIGVENLTTGTTYNIETSIQIEKGSTATDYEPYVGGTPSPNPDYPQDIRVVTGNNTINVHGKNLFDKDNILIGYIKEDGTLSTDNAYRTSDFILIQPNTTYYKTLTQSPRTKYFDKNKQPLNTATYQDISIGGRAGTFTTPNNAYYLRFSFPFSGSSAIDINTIMINEGSATTYEPYQSQDYEIDLTNNKFKINYDEVTTDLKYIPFQLEPNTNYLMNTTLLKNLNNSSNTAFIFLLNGNVTTGVNTTNNGVWLGNPRVVSSDENGYITVAIRQASKNPVNFNEHKTILIKADEEFYDYELCKIGDYKDVIFKNNQLSEYYDSTLDEDSWYVKKNIGKVVVDTSNITLRSNYTNIEYAEITKPNDFIGKGNYDDYNVYCSHAVSDIKNAIQYAWDSTYRIGKITNKATTDNLWLGFSKGTGLDNIKTALNGAVIYYVLATPTYEIITNETLINQLEAIETETGTNIFEVSNDNDVLPSLNVKRLKELEKLS